MLGYTIIKIRFSSFTPFFVALFVAGLFLFSIPAHAQTLESTLKGATEKVEELQAIGQNKELTDEERETREISARKDALKKILELTVLEDKELKSKLDGLENLNEKEEALRERLRAIFEEHQAAYDILRTRIEETNDLEEIKQLASDFKNWRKAAYDPRMKNVVDFTLIFKQRAVLGVTHARLNKIISDLKKLEGAKLLAPRDTSAQLERAIQEIKKAKELNSRALDEFTLAIRPFYEKDEYDENEPQEQENKSGSVEQKEEITIRDEEPEHNEEGENEDENAETTQGKDARISIEQSLEHIKGAYQNFIEISTIVRTKLGIK